MKKLYILFSLFICACSSVRVPENFVYKEIQTDKFKIATWQKIANPNGAYMIYIEGDGRSFDSQGQLTGNPTPKGRFVRELAFGDPNENVVYMARPCQFVRDSVCESKYWSSARFAPEVVDSIAQAIRKTAGENQVVLVGYSGGAQVAGLVAVRYHDLHIKKLVTIAGNLDHKAWTEFHRLPPLDGSLNLVDYRDVYGKFEQVHYAGDKDGVIPSFLIYDFVSDKNTVIIVPGATHSSGFGLINRLY